MAIRQYNYFRVLRISISSSVNSSPLLAFTLLAVSMAFSKLYSVKPAEPPQAKEGINFGGKSPPKTLQTFSIPKQAFSSKVMVWVAWLRPQQEEEVPVILWCFGMDCRFKARCWVCWICRFCLPILPKK